MKRAFLLKVGETLRGAGCSALVSSAFRSPLWDWIFTVPQNVLLDILVRERACVRWRKRRI